MNPYISQGTSGEQNLLESLIIESLSIYAQPMLYMPRTLVALDKILGEDPRSTFKTAYNIPVFVSNVMGFDGQGAFLSNAGFAIDQSAKLIVARKTWQTIVGNDGKSLLPNRPAEGDLIYFPLTSGIFEIKYVQHQNPFYQLGKLYVYEMDVNLFSYSSETMSTGVDSIDKFNLKSLDVTLNPMVDDANQSEADNLKIDTEYQTKNAMFNPTNPFNE